MPVPGRMLAFGMGRIKKGEPARHATFAKFEHPSPSRISEANPLTSPIKINNVIKSLQTSQSPGRALLKKKACSHALNTIGKSQKIIVSSKKGKGGGYYLRHKPEEVNLAQVLRVFDVAISLLHDVTYKFYERCEECKDENTYSIREAFQEVRDNTVRIFKNTPFKPSLTGK